MEVDGRMLTRWACICVCVAVIQSRDREDGVESVLVDSTVL